MHSAKQKDKIQLFQVTGQSRFMKTRCISELQMLKISQTEVRRRDEREMHNVVIRHAMHKGRDEKRLLISNRWIRLLTIAESQFHCCQAGPLRLDTGRVGTGYVMYSVMDR